MRVLIIGGGGREHTLAWKIAQSPLLEKLYCAPGNPGIAGVAECIDIAAEDISGLKKWALENKIDLTVVGPEAPLVKGLAEEFRESKMMVFGPDSKGARLEGSKVWAKRKMKQWGIPTAEFAVFDDFDDARRHLSRFYGGPVVIKADGLAAGKGVTVASGPAEAEQALYDIMIEKAFGEAGDRVIIEQCLSGEEVSVLAITDGKELIYLPSAQDHKAIGEGDTGPNTGGMGAYSPAPIYTDQLAEKTVNNVFKPLLRGFKESGIDFRGVIYAGLMVSGNEFNVLEFNVRFGDPETQAILPRMKSDLLPLLMKAARGDLAGERAEWLGDPAVCVVLASKGYPGSYDKGFMIEGIGRAVEDGGGKVAVFHAGTREKDNRLVTGGGRVLGVTAWDEDLKKALRRVYDAAGKIYFEGCYYRKDIAYRALNGGGGQ
ncbi:MAG: phosphoribosylamine--glycine ligase [Bacillota bacterium]|nr:phosphoribosylamine--glycine ligase [Bacillota bacterium]